MDAPPEDRTGSPAVGIALVAGLAGLLLSLEGSAFAVSLFLSLVAVAALPMALADRPGGRAVGLALLGAGCGLLGLVLVVSVQLLGETQRGQRDRDPFRGSEGVRPRATAPAPAATPAPVPAPASAPASAPVLAPTPTR